MIEYFELLDIFPLIIKYEESHVEKMARQLDEINTNSLIQYDGTYNCEWALFELCIKTYGVNHTRGILEKKLEKSAIYTTWGKRNTGDEYPLLLEFMRI